jgi:hypothetical protein
VAPRAIECRWCGNALSEEEADSPRRDDDNDPICDECWHNEYEFTCCWCQNYENVAHQDYLVISEPTPAMGLGPGYGPLNMGVYKIVDSPYFGGPLIGLGYLFANALEFVADLPDGIDTNGYPCGHLCRECYAKLPQTQKVG